MIIKCIVVDDEPLAVDLLKDNIRKVPFLNCVETFTSAKKAHEYLNNNKVDLAFLDIQMPGMSGLELASKHPEFMIIFTTAFDEYAIDGFEISAIDYILKPILFNRFEKACFKAKEYFALKNKTDLSYVFVRSEHQTIKLILNDIVYIEGLKDYVKIFIINNPKPVLTRTNLKGILELLNSQNFVRIHKSYIINTKHLLSHNTDHIQTPLIDLPIGDSYKAIIRTFTKM